MTNKKNFIIGGLLVAGLAIGVTAIAQTDNGDGDKKKKKHEERIEFVIKDGEKTVTIEKNIDGKKSKEVLTGKEAEEYMAKHHHKDSDLHIGTHGTTMVIDIEEDLEGMDEDMKELMEKIKIQLSDLEDGTSELIKDLDIKVLSGDDLDLEKLLKELDIDIDIDFDIDEESQDGKTKSKTVKKIIISTDEKEEKDDQK